MRPAGPRPAYFFLWAAYRCQPCPHLPVQVRLQECWRALGEAVYWAVEKSLCTHALISSLCSPIRRAVVVFGL